MNIRLAIPTEAKFLTNLAVSSEGYWGFGQEFLDIFKEQYSVTEKYIENNHVLILEDSLNILGFFSLETLSKTLNHFYISSNLIGSGYGQIMWYFLISYCKKESIASFSLVATPEVVNFYSKLGAKVVRVGESSINNREVYFLEYHV
ncbi:GNAT family N-acetyltransferase [Psychrilyobacter atlanticus]|uniref:GNAT family N-acetyltransferase n=1 Tax=Psychrilyobacter atlanticus TaxID=271091 RepID=UPI00040C5353|nr:GNAT family N-acetyltransferase [Psychrilyobacter atlanticus]